MGCTSSLTHRLAEVLAGREGLIAAYLFGSRATGEAHAASDADVALLGEKPLPLDEVVSLAAAMEEAAGVPIDLLDLRRAEPFLAFDVLRGARFLEPIPLAADEYELYIMRRAGDLAPFERERRRMLLASR